MGKVAPRMMKVEVQFHSIGSLKRQARKSRIDQALHSHGIKDRLKGQHTAK